MNFGIHHKVSGDYALFSRPEMKVERASYAVMPPSAARDVLEAIYWKQQIPFLRSENQTITKCNTLPSPTTRIF